MTEKERLFSCSRTMVESLELAAKNMLLIKACVGGHISDDECETYIRTLLAARTLLEHWLENFGPGVSNFEDEKSPSRGPGAGAGQGSEESPWVELTDERSEYAEFLIRDGASFTTALDTVLIMDDDDIMKALVSNGLRSRESTLFTDYLTEDC